VELRHVVVQGSTIGTGNAGTINSTVGNPRQLQLALRVQF
jgi:hypothetical protein